MRKGFDGLAMLVQDVLKKAEHLKAQLAVLRRTRFGRSSEKLDREIEQLELLLGELEEGVAESNARTKQAEKEPASPRRATPRDHKPTGRKPLPAHLPREQVTHAPQGACNWLRRHGVAQDR
jgi:transposase